MATAVVYAVATPTWAVVEPGAVGSRAGPAGAGGGALGRSSARGRRLGGSRLAGLGAGLMVASRPSTTLLAAGIAAFASGRLGSPGRPVRCALGAVWRRRGRGTTWRPSARSREATRSSTGRMRSTTAWRRAWSGSFLEGLVGVLVSPSRGLFVYAPVLLFPVAGLVLWLDRGARGGLLACAAAATAWASGPSPCSRSGGAGTPSGPGSSPTSSRRWSSGSCRSGRRRRRSRLVRRAPPAAFAASVAGGGGRRLPLPLAARRGVEHQPAERRPGPRAPLGLAGSPAPPAPAERAGAAGVPDGP